MLSPVGRGGRSKRGGQATKVTFASDWPAAVLSRVCRKLGIMEDGMHFPCAGPGVVVQGRSQISPTLWVGTVIWPELPTTRSVPAVIEPSGEVICLVPGFLKEAVFLCLAKACQWKCDSWNQA